MQLDYGLTMDPAFAGMKKDIRPDWVESYAAELDVDFGLWVEYGTDPENQCAVYTNGLLAGVSIHTHKSPGVDDGYDDEETVNVLRKGVVWMQFDEDALGVPVKGGQVYARPTSGLATPDANRGVLVQGSKFFGTSQTLADGTVIVPVEVDMTGLGGQALVTIDNLDIGGLEPVAGEEPVLLVDNAQWFANVEWNEPMDGDGNFDVGTDYTCEITVTPKAGFTVEGIGADSWVITDSDTDTNAEDSGVVDATWATTAATVTALDLELIVTAPVNGATAVEVIDEAQYTGTVVWDPALVGAGSDEFDASTIYEATVELTAKAGFTFYGVAADDFVHAGATSINNNADSGRVVITFPATGA